MRSVRGTRRPLVALIALVVALIIGYSVRAARAEEVESARPPVVALSALPAQVAETVRLIRGDGPFPYPGAEDVLFPGENALPREPRGWYHEYKVPGSADHGARRLITGRDGTLFYTDDDDKTFRRVDTVR